MVFDESKHPRDEIGRFTEKGGEISKAGEAKRVFELADKLGIEYNRNTNYQIIKARVEQAEKEKHKEVSLSKQEWAQYYKIIGDEQHGDFVYRIKNGQRVVRLENKIILDNGDFENPRVSEVISFPTNDTMNDTLDLFVKKGIIK